ncbi:MAG TPA: hypothetical protein VN240_00280, partial [Propylenella sp.]|nr:hypothetical protein [Propylenella sp.]
MLLAKRMLSGAAIVAFSVAAGSSDARPVDLQTPTFSNPTAVTNPLFPVATIRHSIKLGEEAGEPMRVELTLLPETRTIEWNGQAVETLVSHYIAYVGGEVAEVAVDYFAQADDGSVWYFGEEVDNYEEGRVADHAGSWLAGRDGPPGLIMPAQPQVGDVYHPENIPGLVYEETTVQAVGETVDGPRGPVDGAIRVEEHLMEGTTEHKVFAPGYGEFRAEAEDELVTMAIAVPTDSLGSELPAELAAMLGAARALFEAAPSGDEDGLSGQVQLAEEAWQRLGARQLPKLLAEQADEAVAALRSAADEGETEDVRQAAVDLARAALDLRLQYRPPSEVDLGRLDAWARQLIIDAEAGEGDAASSSVAILEAIWQRIRHAVDAGPARLIEERLAELRAAADADELGAAAAGAMALVTLL